MFGLRLTAVIAVCSALVIAAAVRRPASAQELGGGFAGGDMQEINPSGAWSWFEGPRAILTDCELIVGTVSSSAMTEISTTPIGSRASRVDQVGGPFEPDDHNSPGFAELPSGKVAAAWSRHHVDYVVHNLVRPQAMWNWFETESVRARDRVTYSNLAHLSDEGPSGRLYNFFRGNGLDTIFSYSDDDGQTWTEPAKLLRKYSERPYPVYDDDAVSRIDVATTEGHPAEFTPGTGVFHGYVEGGFIRRSDGEAIGPAAYGVAPEELTRVYQQTPDERAWTLDMASPTDSQPATMVLSVRDVAESTPNHRRNRYLYATWDGARWNVEPLAWAGSSLYASQEFYTGGVAIDPTDSRHVVLSTNVDPTTGIPLVPAPGRTVAAHELFDGFTDDGGATWDFVPITGNSAETNIRPVIPEPSAAARSLVWLSGDYRNYLDYDLRVLGIVEGEATGHCPEPLETYGPDPFPGDFDGDGLTDWFHYRPGTAPETVFWGDGDRTDVSVNGTYDPQVRRLTDGRDQIIWASPAGSYRWDEVDHGFVSSSITHAANVRLLAGDFDGDDVDDLFHYRPGSASDRIYWSDGTSTPLNVSGTYTPMIGDFTGDGTDGILWYAPGAGPDSYWTFLPGHRWRSSATAVSGTYDVAVGDIDGNGVDDVFWRRADGGGYHWLHGPAPTPAPTSVVVR